MKLVIGDDAGSLIPILSLVVTLVSVIVGPLVAIRIAKKQIHASVISSTRQQWISSLRDVFAEFLTLAHHISASNGVGLVNEGHVEKVQKLVLLQNKMQLFLDPSEQISKDLIAKAEEIRSTAFRTKPATSAESAVKIGNLAGEFMLIAKVILKKELFVISEEIDS